MTLTDDDLRRDIAACSRMLVTADILNYSGHISARSVLEDHFLIQPVHDVRARLRPERLLLVDLDGRVVRGEGSPPSEVFIHAEIYRARADARSVAHFHHDPTTVFSVVDGVPLVAMKNHASRWIDGIPVHFDASHIDSPKKGREVVTTLDRGYALLLRGHGEVVVAEDVRALYADVVHFVENARTQRLALQCGSPQSLTAEEQDNFLRTFNRRKHASKLWTYYTTIAAANGVLPNEWLDPAAAVNFVPAATG